MTVNQWREDAVRQFGKYRLLLLLPVTALLLSGTTEQKQGNNRFTHTVAAGESVSLICIDYYGYYSATLGTTVLADNPSIKNIDLIRVGQKLSLRKPVEAAPAETADAIAGSAKSADTVAQTAETTIRKMSISQGVVTCVEGEVHWSRSASAPLQQLKINTVVAPGNVIETSANGRVEIVINREAVVRLRENTRTVLEAYRDLSSGNGTTKLKCSAGGWWTRVKKFKDRISRFEMELPTAVAGVHGTIYETSVTEDGSSEVKVFSGEVAVHSATGGIPAATAQAVAATPVEVAGPQEVPPPHEVPMEQWTEIVRSMQRISIDKKGIPSKPVSFTKANGDWEQWNEQRDRRIARIFGE